jgi:hypothetical protein
VIDLRNAGARQRLARQGSIGRQRLSRPSGGKETMKGIAKMIYEGLIELGIILLVLLAVVLLPLAAVVTRTLIPFTVAMMGVLFLATCFSRRMQNWLYR